MMVLAEILSVAAELVAAWLFFRGIRGRRQLTWEKRLLAWVVLGIGILAFTLTGHMVVCGFLFSIVGLGIVLYLCFAYRLWQAFVAALLFVVMVRVIGLLDWLLFIFCGVAGMSMLKATASLMLFLLFNRLLLFGVVMLLYMFYRKEHDALAAKIILPLLDCWLTVFIVCWIVRWQVMVTDDPLPFSSCLLLTMVLLMNLMMLYYTHRLYTKEERIRDLALQAHHLDMQQEYYDRLYTQQEELRGISHDINKYMHGILQDAGPEEFQKMLTANPSLARFQERVDAAGEVRDFGNRTVNVILDSYLRQARSQGIHLEANVRVHGTLPISAADLYILFGNTLDNAFAACAELPQEKRWVEVRLLQQERIVFYDCRNPYLPEHLKKPSTPFHGYGLKNLAHCVELYDGGMTVSQENGIYHVAAHMNFPSENETGQE